MGTPAKQSRASKRRTTKGRHRRVGDGERNRKPIHGVRQGSQDTRGKATKLKVTEKR